MVYEQLDSLLTEAEKKVYLALLQLGESTASPILEKTGIQNSVFYRTINRLIEKGFVSFVKKGKIKHFLASKPEVFLTQLKDKEESIKQILPQLKELQKISENKTQAEVFIGVKGVKAMLYGLVEEAKPNEEYLFFSMKRPEFDKSVVDIYIPFRNYRAEKKLKVKGIHRADMKDVVESVKNCEDRFLDFPLPPNMAIFRDKIAITSWGDIPTGILIKSKDIAEQYKELFKELWKLTKK